VVSAPETHWNTVLILWYAEVASVHIQLYKNAVVCLISEACFKRSEMKF